MFRMRLFFLHFKGIFFQLLLTVFWRLRSPLTFQYFKLSRLKYVSENSSDVYLTHRN
jgi:hypothetical protein